MILIVVVCSGMEICRGDEMYVPMAEVLRMKREQERQKEMVGCPSSA